MNNQRKITMFLVGYFPIVGLIMFPGLGKLLALFYLYFLWQRWNNTKLVVSIGVSAFLSILIFGVFFAFLFPVWIAIGIIFFSYGYAIGIFKKSTDASTSNALNFTLPIISRRRKIVSGLCLFGALLGVLWVSAFGFSLRPCEYTFEEAAIPSILIDTKIILEKDVYLAKGIPPDTCKWSGPIIENDIIDNETIDNKTIGKKYYERHGRSVSKLKKEKTFNLIKILARTRHGIGSMFSSSPIYFLLLKDEMGTIYRIAVVNLGHDEKDAFFGYYKGTTKLGVLSWKFFLPYFHEEY